MEVVQSSHRNLLGNRLTRHLKIALLVALRKEVFRAPKSAFLASTAFWSTSVRHCSAQSGAREAGRQRIGRARSATETPNKICLCNADGADAGGGPMKLITTVFEVKPS
jgi:hypothetical protein